MTGGENQKENDTCDTRKLHEIQILASTKFCWGTAMLICFCIVCGYFSAAGVEVSTGDTRPWCTQEPGSPVSPPPHLRSLCSLCPQFLTCSRPSEQSSVPPSLERDLLSPLVLPTPIGAGGKFSTFFFMLGVDFFFFINLFICLFLAALGLRCCARAFSSCGE